MIIIDQNKVELSEDDFDFIGDVHRKMVDFILFETIEKLSCTGLTILQSGGRQKEIEAMKLWDKVDPFLSHGEDYDFKTSTEEYKIINLKFS